MSMIRVHHLPGNNLTNLMRLLSYLLSEFPLQMPCRATCSFNLRKLLPATNYYSPQSEFNL